MFAAQNGRTALVGPLIAAGADPNKRAGGLTALWLASQEGYADTVKALADGGADVDVADDAGVTALMIAVANGHADVVDALLTARANPDLLSMAGVSASLIAAANGDSAEVQALVGAGADVDLPGPGSDRDDCRRCAQQR